MNKRSIKVILAAVLSISLLSGCGESEKQPVQLESASSAPSANGEGALSAQQSDTSAAEESKPTDSADSGNTSSSSEGTSSSAQSSEDSSSSSEPTSTDTSTSTTTPVSSSAPQSTATSTDTSTTPVSSSAPQSTSTTTGTTTPVSSSKPQSTSTTTSTSKPVSSSKPQSTTSTTTNPTPSGNASILNNYTSKWAYNQLSEKQKAVYAKLFKAASNKNADCDVKEIGLSDVGDVDTAFWAFDYDNPQFLELGSGYKYSYIIPGGKTEKDKIITTVTIDYGRKSSDIKQSDFDSITQGVLTKARAQSTDYDKLKYVHDWIVNNTVYTLNESLYISEADGPVIYKKALCEGYSKAFMYYAQSMGFDCVCVMGYGNGGSHMWNKVKLNGKWYNVDVTWDDPIMNTGEQVLRHDYFLISDAQIKKDHRVDSPFALPQASANYAQ